MRALTTCLWVVTTMAIACGGEIDVESSAGNGGAGSTASSTGSTTGSTVSTAASSGHGGSSAQGGGNAVGGAGGAGGAGAAGGGGGGELPEVCQQMQQVQIDSVTLNAGPDGVWSAGETAMLEVTLWSPIEVFSYPGTLASHSTAGVTPAMNENWLFGLNANQPNTLGMPFDASADVPAGTLVSFQIEVAALNQPCLQLDTAQLQVVIQ